MIRINDLKFNYQRKRDVFTSLDLELEAGHVYGLLGRNGAGKSTLLKLICGLLFPAQGLVEVMGQEPRLRNPSFLSDVFLIPEEVFLPDIKMSEYVRNMSPFYPHFDAEELKGYLREFNVSEQEKLGTLSFGQKKKALISFALACNTRLLVMDEPTNGLDIPSKGEFRRVIASVLNEERCVVISTHQVRDLENLIDAVVILEDSRVLLNATTDRITEKLVFKTLAADEPALFDEMSLKGRWGVAENVGGQESKIDMELFFNAVLNDPAKIQHLFDAR